MWADKLSKQNKEYILHKMKRQQRHNHFFEMTKVGREKAKNRTAGTSGSDSIDSPVRSSLWL